MELPDMLGVAFKVIGDWRVVFITVAVLIVFAILRYVGLVYHKKSRSRAPRPGIGGGPGSAVPGAAKSAVAEPPDGAEE